MKIFLLSCWALFSFSCFASEFEVLRLQGEVTLNQTPLSVGESYKLQGLLETQARSFVKIRLVDQAAELVLGGNARLVLEEKADQPMVLEAGATRWIREAKNSVREKTTTTARDLATAQVAMGVRGTNFFVKTNPLLGESEIVVFEGVVDFVNRAEESDRQRIVKGQWGGLGGRFGAQVTTPIDLPKEALEHFDRYLKL